MVSTRYMHWLHRQSIMLVGGGKTIDWLQVHGKHEMAWINHHWDRKSPIDIHYVSGCRDLSEMTTHYRYRPEFIWMNIPMCYCVPDMRQEPIRQYAIRENKQLGYFFQTEHVPTNPIDPELEWSNTLYRELGTMPLTGIVAIEHLLRQPLAQLFVTGMDFFRTGDILPRRIGPHEIEPQVEWLRRKRHCDRRLTCDARLTEILNGKPQYEEVEEQWIAPGIRMMKSSAVTAPVDAA